MAAIHRVVRAQRFPADWMAKLLNSKKERLLISGHGLDRLAVLIDGEWAPG